MEITSIMGPGHIAHSPEHTPRLPTLAEQRAAAVEKQRSATAPQTEDITTVVDELRLFTSALNRRLKFTISSDLDQVVVKVIDKRTDKVIKELPPEGIRRLHARIQEALGLLIDEVI